MSLATRCTACGTIFRVVQDQLKVSEGWVRCGRCDAVFNAMQGLFDLERDAPPAWPATLPTVVNEVEGVSQQDHYANANAAANANPNPNAAASANLQPREFAAPPIASFEIDERGHSHPQFASAQIQATELRSASTQMVSPPPSEALRSVAPKESAAFSAEPTFVEQPFVEPNYLEPPPSEPQPGGQNTEFTEFLASEQTPSSPDFIRHADKEQRWKSSDARLTLALAALVALLALGAQITHHFRDLIAAQWPQSKATLVSACAWVPCQISLPRRIDDLAVESTSLTHSIPGSDAFKLSVSLKNRGRLSVALPSIDLSLTDASGQLVARRALAPSDFLASPAGLDAGADTTLNLMLTASDKKVSGYTVEVFYP